MGYQLDNTYKEVPQRIADLKAVHPDARLRPVRPDKPFDIVEIDNQTFIVYAAACYRDAADPLPGIGVAWEPFPGKTPYTKDSELMNAETSAWGRAIVATLRSESKSVASAQDVRNRQAERAMVSAGKAKTRLLEACGGDKDAAANLWGDRGSKPIAEAELLELEQSAKDTYEAPFEEGA